MRPTQTTLARNAATHSSREMRVPLAVVGPGHDAAADGVATAAIDVARAVLGGGFTRAFALWLSFDFRGTAGWLFRIGRGDGNFAVDRFAIDCRRLAGGCGRGRRWREHRVVDDFAAGADEVLVSRDQRHVGIDEDPAVL